MNCSISKGKDRAVNRINVEKLVTSTVISIIPISNFRERIAFTLHGYWLTIYPSSPAERGVTQGSFNLGFSETLDLGKNSL